MNIPIFAIRGGRRMIGYTIIDDDMAELAEANWGIGSGRSRRYLRASFNGSRISLHRLVYIRRHGDIPDGFEIDHIDRNQLNNLSSNLRAVTRSFNQANRPRQSNNISGYKCVKWYKQYSKWTAVIKKNGKQIFLGYFDDIKDAAHAVNAAYAVHFPGVASPNTL